MYVDGFVYAVPKENKDRFVADADHFAQLLREHGATRVVECWGDDIPDGKVTSFPLAVQLKPGEVVCFSWVEFADKETRDRCHAAVEADPRAAEISGPEPAFDGARMIFGSFMPVVER